MSRRKKSNRTHDATDRARARRQFPARRARPRQANGSRTKARQQDTRNRALHALALMRRGESLSAACKAEHIKPETFRRYVGGAVRHDKPGGRFRVAKADALRRELQVPTADGPVQVSVRGIKKAREFSEHLNAIAHFNRTGDMSRLEKFKGRTFTSNRRRHAFLTDRAKLLELAEADALRLDDLYTTVSSNRR